MKNYNNGKELYHKIEDEESLKEYLESKAYTLATIPTSSEVRHEILELLDIVTEYSDAWMRSNKQPRDGFVYLVPIYARWKKNGMIPEDFMLYMWDLIPVVYFDFVYGPVLKGQTNH